MTLETFPLQPKTIDSQESFPATVKIWHGNSCRFPADGTTFGYIYEGSAVLFRPGKEPNRIYAGMYFCLPGEGKLEGKSSGIGISHLNYQGLFSLGAIAPTGEFAYINGGTNSLLIAPVKGGDPCLNAMYFPPGVDQTLHTHPSYRLGIVVEGGGKLENQQTVLVLKPGMTFLIGANSLHKFRTLETNLTAVVFHPDSDIKFTRGDNLMLKRTIINGVSASELPDIQTKLGQ